MNHRWTLIFCVVLGVAVPGNCQASGVRQEAPLRLLLSEVQSGVMSTEHYCMLVFADRRFHAEKATLWIGKDQERRVYEGGISDGEWNALDGILESDGFRSLNVPADYVPLTVQGAHFFTISVRREKGFQNMEFMNDNSRKPYDTQLKPLLHWWKSARSKRMVPSQASADNRCKLDSSRGVFSY